MFCDIRHQRNDADAAKRRRWSQRRYARPITHARRTDCRHGKSRSHVQQTTDLRASRRAQPPDPARPAQTGASADHSPPDSPPFPTDAGMLRTTLMVSDEQPSADQRCLVISRWSSLSPRVQRLICRPTTRLNFL